MKQLCLKKRKKHDQTSTGVKEIVDVYNFKVTMPPGLTNPANNCYANSLFQCLFNTRTFSDVLELEDGQGR